MDPHLERGAQSESPNDPQGLRAHRAGGYLSAEAESPD